MRVSKFSEFYKQESILDDFVLSLKENIETESPEDSEILKRYYDKFGDKEPSNQEFAEFYHDLRSEGYDGIRIFDLLDSEKEKSNKEETTKDGFFLSIAKNVIKDLKLDSNLVFTFGTGIGALYPVIQTIMSNTGGFELTKETIVLLTISVVTIIYLEEKKSKNSEEEARLTKDSRSMLEELRMRGIGDGIVKKVIKCIQSFKNIFSIISKHIGTIINSVIDMFAYTAILVPIMNGILFVIGKHEMGIDDVISNFFSLSMGFVTRLAKHGLIELLGKIRNLINDKQKEEIIDEIETPKIQKFGDFTTGNKGEEQDGELIKEQ